MDKDTDPFDPDLPEFDFHHPRVQHLGRGFFNTDASWRPRRPKPRFSLQTLRKSLDVTQTALAERGGMKQSEVSRLERGEVDCMLSTLERYAQGLGGALRVSLQINGGDYELDLRARAEVTLPARP